MANKCKCGDGRILTYGPNPGGTGPYDCNSLRASTCAGCCSGGTAASVQAPGGGIAITRGVPSQGAIDRGPRGQVKAFRNEGYSNFVPAPNCWSGCPNPTGIYFQGTPNQFGETPMCPPSHPNNQPPNCAPPPPPPNPIIYGPNNYPSLLGLNATFVNNMDNGYNQFGCSFLYNRHSVIQARLNDMIAAGTHPGWQERLENKIYYINLLISQYCIMY